MTAPQDPYGWDRHRLKPGVKTTEFGIVVAIMCFAAVALALGEKDVAMAALAAAGLSGGGYALSRGKVKAG